MRNEQPWYKHQVVQFIFLLLAAFAIRTFLYGLYQVPTGSMETTMLVGERFLADKLSYWFRKPERGEIIAFNNPNYPYSSHAAKRLFEQYVWGPENWTKRVIGVPGDHVEGKIEEGKPVVYVNGEKLEEPYLNQHPLVALFKDGPPSMQRPYYALENRSFVPGVAWVQQPYYRINPRDLAPTPEAPDILYPGVPSPDGSDIFDVTLKNNEYWVMGDNRRGSHDSRAWGPLSGNAIHGRIIFRIWSLDSGDDWFIFDLLKHPIDFWKRIRYNRCLQRVK